MSGTTTETQFEAMDADAAPDHFQILSAYELVPDDITTTPPAHAKLFMSPNFTNPEGADADHGKTRDYVVVIQYPAGMENTVVRMNDCSTVHGSRIFRKFVENTAAEKGYTAEQENIEKYLTDAGDA